MHQIEIEHNQISGEQHQSLMSRPKLSTEQQANEHEHFTPELFVDFRRQSNVFIQLFFKTGNEVICLKIEKQLRQTLKILNYYRN